MCGFVGLATSARAESPARAELEAMAATLVHRGPDDQHLHVAGPIGLGFRRLSIIDVAGGRQPLYNEDGTIALVLNGEVYNFRELRAGLQARGHTLRTGSDAETFVHLYEERGPAAVEALVGMYAFALSDLRDPARPRLLLGRDRLGIKPLYWCQTAEGLAFASQPKALLAWERGRLPRTLRAQALLDYLVQGYVGGPESAWSGIHRLPPATTLSWLPLTPGAQPELRRYWDLPRDALRAPATSEEILEWLDRVVREHLVSDVPLGAFLSGGIDSNAVADSMARASDQPPVLCSVGFEERSHDELELARASARRLRAVHHTEVLRPDPALALDELPWFFDEPLADPSSVPTWLVSRMARRHVTVALSGDGGDETFAGYRRYVHDAVENRVRARLGQRAARAAGALGRHYPRLQWAPRPLRARTFLTNLGSEPGRAYWRSVTQLELEEARELLAPDLRVALAEHDPFYAFERHYRAPAVEDPLYRAQYADFHTYLPDQILAKVDRASMAVSLEVRVPLLDHRIAERFAPLPAAEKVREGRGKHALREALRARLPAEILDGAKRGFDTPLRAWLRGPLASACAEAIESVPADWLDRAALRERLADHQNGLRDHGRLLWSVLVLERWRRCHAVRGLAP
jgi:asparagine synthase (glutamine-hydrolysing)